MSVSANIRKRRFELKMSQQELATAMGYKSRATIAKIESGENDVNQTKLEKYARVLDTTVEYLISGSEIISPHAQFAEVESNNSDHSTFRNKNVVIIMAGGKSSRNQQNIPNQFINVLGKPVIVYCMEVYQYHPSIDDIYVVCLKGWESIVKAYAKQFKITKLKGLIPAGPTGIVSVKYGIDHLLDKYNKDDIVIIQESTRPMVSAEIISKLLQSTNDLGSANICETMRDYLLFTVSKDKTTTVNRKDTVEVQSPEAFKLEIISSIFEKALQKKHPFNESCCAILLDNLNYPIHFIEGSTTNVKIIRQEDIAVFTSLITQHQT